MAGGPPPPTPVRGVTPGHTCNAQGTESFVGQVPDGGTGAAILRTSNAAVLRWAQPGVMMTMDLRADRVTVWLGPDGKITRVRCG